MIYSIKKYVFGLSPPSGTELLKPLVLPTIKVNRVSFVMLMKGLSGMCLKMGTGYQEKQPGDWRVGTFSPTLWTSRKKRGAGG